MTAAKPKTLIALTSFTCEVKDVPYIIGRDQLVASNHPAVKGREELFAAYDPKAPKAA